MYSLTISFGPTGTVWAFLFKDKETANGVFDAIHEQINEKSGTYVQDDFGQRAMVVLPIHGICLEDLDQVEAARIYRSLAEERLKVKLMEAARADPVIRAAIAQQNRAPVLTPMGGFRQ